MSQQQQQQEKYDDEDNNEEGQKQEKSEKDSPRGKSKEERKKEREERKRRNKIYRTPPTPEPKLLREKEKTFVLDNLAVSSISNDFSLANPKLGPVIPPYNSQNDKLVHNYFKFVGVDKTLKKTGQASSGTSISGKVMDYFHDQGAGYQYLSKRNASGAGHSAEFVDGHAQFMEGVKPMQGFNGKYGFRRNTPWLRQIPSTFGVTSRYPIHEFTTFPRIPPPKHSEETKKENQEQLTA